MVVEEETARPGKEASSEGPRQDHHAASLQLQLGHAERGLRCCRMFPGWAIRACRSTKMEHAMPQETVVYSRDRLYEQIWKEPVHEVAKAYGISDVALAKVCRRLNVPRPSRAYWARRRAGHEVSPVPLPPLRAGEPAEHKVTRWKPDPPPPLSSEEIAFRARPEFQARQVELPFSLVVPAVLEQPHRFVLTTLKGLRKAKPDRDGLVSPQGGLPVAIGPDQVDRAMRFLDTLIKGVERAGHKVLPLKSYTERWRIVIDGVEIEFEMRERLVRAPHVPINGEYFAPQWDHHPSGDLRLKLKWDRAWRLRRQWDESPRFRIDANINDIFRAILQIAPSHHAALAQRAARQQVEQERAERRRQEEARQLDEQRRADAVVALATRWQQARLVHDFVESVRAEANRRFGTVGPESTAAKWLDHAASVAVRLDPVPDLFGDRSPKRSDSSGSGNQASEGDEP